MIVDLSKVSVNDASLIKGLIWYLIQQGVEIPSFNIGDQSFRRWQEKMLSWLKKYESEDIH